MEEIKVNVEQKNGVIKFNFEEIKELVSQEADKYKGIIFTEDSKKEAKDTVAFLRKANKSLDDRRKEVKKAYMQPFTDFESKVKELQAIINQPISEISAQVEEFERKRVEEKRELIKQLYAEIIADMGEYLPLNRIYDTKWENSTVTKKSIVEAITNRVCDAQKDIETIKSFNSDFEDKGLESYKQTLELSSAIQIMNNYQKQREEILAREQAKKEAEINADKQEEEPVTVKAEQIPNDKIENHGTTYVVNADTFQLVQLESYMRENNIAYRRV